MVADMMIGQSKIIEWPRAVGLWYVRWWHRQPAYYRVTMGALVWLLILKIWLLIGAILYHAVTR